MNEINYPDPAYRFTVVLKDGREIMQEDEKGRVVLDHCNIDSDAEIEIYSLRNRPGDHVISVNFDNGSFSINGEIVKMMFDDFDLITDKHRKIKFKPKYGRRKVGGNWGERTFFFCGWETTYNNKKFKRVLLVDEHGRLYFEC